MDSEDRLIEARRPERSGSGVQWITIALIAFVFAVTGPVMVLLEMAGHLAMSRDELQTLIVVTCVVGGSITIWVSLTTRQPMAIVWSLPAVAFLLSSNPIQLSDLVGATLLTGVLLIVIGWRRLDERLMRRVSSGVMFGMIGGVLTPFVLAIPGSFLDRPGLVTAMVGAHLAVAIARRWIPLPPPLLAALAAGVVVSRPSPDPISDAELLAMPQLLLPTFDPAVMAGVVLPFIITVIAVQNAQGLSLLALAGHRPSSWWVTVLCGASSVVQAAGGCPPSSLAGPMEGILTSSSRPERQYRSAVVFGVLYILFGVFSPRILEFVTRFPSHVVTVVAGLALLPITIGSLRRAARSRDLLGAVVAFAFTISQVSLLGLPSAFWGLALGMLPQLARSLWRSGVPEKKGGET